MSEESTTEALKRLEEVEDESFKAMLAKHAKQIEVVIREAEVIKLNVQPGDVLFFKFKGDDFYNDDVQRLGDRLRKMFVNNKVVVMALPKDHDVELTVAKENVTTENEALLKDCSKPTSYCNDCHCGKKEAIENARKSED